VILQFIWIISALANEPLDALRHGPRVVNIGVRRLLW